MSYHWKTKIKLALTWNSIVNELVPVDSFRHREMTDKEIRDALSDGNLQVIHKWPRYTWSLRIPVNADYIKNLVWLQKKNQSFTLELSENQPDGVEQSMKIGTVLLTDCMITNRDMEVVANDLPVVVFDGIALKETTDGISDSRGTLETAMPVT